MMPHAITLLTRRQNEQTTRDAVDGAVDGDDVVRLQAVS